MNKTASPVSQLIGSGSWLLKRRILLSFLNLIVTAGLARILFPEAFGIVAWYLSWMNISQIIAGAGIDDFCIQHEHHNHHSFQKTILTFNLAINGFISLFAGVGFYLYSPEKMAELLPWIMINFLGEQLSNIPKAYLRKSFQYKILTRDQTWTSIFEIILKPILAILGFGAASLVIPGAIMAPIIFVILFKHSGLKPQGSISWLYIKQAFQYLRFSIPSRLLTRILNESDNLIIGTIWGNHALGIYALAFQISNYLNTSVTFIVSDVSVPVFASIKSQPERLKNSFRDIIQLLAFVAFPAFGLLFSLHQEIPVLLLGEKYIETGPILGALCIFSSFRVLNSSSAGLMSALGKPGYTFNIQIIGIPLLLALLYGYASFMDNANLFTFAWILTAGRVVMSMVTLNTAGQLIKQTPATTIQDVTLGIWPALLSASLTMWIPDFDIILINILLKTSVYFISLLIIYRFFANNFFHDNLRKLKNALRESRK